MYLRFTSRTNGDGTVVRYVALAHNRRVDGQTKPDVLMNLGRVEQVDADTQGRVQEAVFFAVANLLNLEVDLLFFDTTSTYFERDDEETGEQAFRRFGHSKDHRSDLPQIVIGLAVTKEGIPVRCWCWPGNASDQAVLAEVKDD